MRLLAVVISLALAACAPARGPVDQLPPDVAGTVAPSPDRTDTTSPMPGLGNIPGRWSPGLL
jgi:hypothetical protein